MASLLPRLDTPSNYKDNQNPIEKEEYEKAMAKTATLYVGNLSFYTSEEQIHELFSKCGEIKRIIMGLDRFKKTPCGFCFVEYYTHEDALDCLRYINSTKLDDRIIRTDLDPGFKEGRQFGRGRSGGQVRDEFRTEFDAGRGGWGHLQAEIEKKRGADLKETYEGMTHAPEGSSNKFVSKKTDSKKKRGRGDDDDDDDSEDNHKRVR